MAHEQKAAPLRKLQPKLRMVANGSTEVNALRAEHASAIKVSGSVAAKVPTLRDDDATPATAEEVPKSVRPRTLTRRPTARLSLFLQFDEAFAELGLDPTKLSGVTATKANLATAELSVSQALDLAKGRGERAAIDYVELGQPLATPEPVVSTGAPDPPSERLRRFGPARRHRYGQDVLIGLIDVGGFDFAHPDFLDRDGKTRFVRIWDQGGSNRPSPAKRGMSGFDYGSELSAEELNRAIRESKKSGTLPAHLLEPQSQMQPGAHATHVASIAAGNRGVCRRAQIAGVLISIPDDDTERRLSFYDSSRIAHAVDYLLELAHELGDKPISINISLGTNGHAHDDSSAIARWIDAALARPGRSVCVAAGNAGQERPEFEGDTGYIMGRIHTSGTIAARALVSDIEWNVVGNGIADISENELEIWYGPQDRFAIQVKPPNEPWTEPIEPGQFIENRQLRDRTFLSVYNELFHPANGANYISVYLSPMLRQEGVIGVQAGQWLVRLLGGEIRDGRYHGWIERDDPRPAGRIGAREAWAFPSFFSERSYVDNSTVSTLACGQRIVSVANLDQAGRRINISSSQGPTRDGRQKPDLTAPGTDIVAASAFTPEAAWVGMTGTSMASPHVAGVIGLMLAVNPDLTAAQIEGILKRTTAPLPGTDFAWRDDSGSGVIDEEEAVEEAAALLTKEDVT
jgi:subtilisin family serine protease